MFDIGIVEGFTLEPTVNDKVWIVQQGAKLSMLSQLLQTSCRNVILVGVGLSC